MELTDTPRARHDHLVMQEIGDEIVLYDLERHRAHCLNPTAARVWRAADGTRTAAEIAAALGASEDLVLLALAQLARAHLVRGAGAWLKLSRRQLLARLGAAGAVALPVVSSLVAPTAAQAGTCLQTGQRCSADNQCCNFACRGGICL